MLTHQHRIAAIGTYPPRRCGIATFTQDLCNAIEIASNHERQCQIMAVNDSPEGYSYCDNVRFEIRQQQPADYRYAADFANIRDNEILLVQHEYGIFGGESGEHLLGLMRNVSMPVVTTLHSVLSNPAARMKKVTQSIIDNSDRVVVMSERAVEIIESLYQPAVGKVRMIPHGIPDLPFIDSSFYKDHFGVQGRTVMLTFGLLSPGKGVEYAIGALPQLVKRHPDLVYVILGATHPHLVASRGEEYRHQLQHLAQDLGVLDHVRFDNRYVDLEELCEFLMATDIYVTPSLAEEQVVSGTLAYAAGAGNAIISTPYTYARELLADGRGRLVEFRDSDSIVREVGDLLDNEPQRQAMRKNAYLYSRRAIWSEVAKSYLELFDEVLCQPSIASLRHNHRHNHRHDHRHSSAVSPLHAVREFEISGLRSKTDSGGILQHARYTVPDRTHG